MVADKGCEQCEPGFFRALSGLCQQCAPSCSTCDDLLACTTCASGLPPDGGSCQEDIYKLLGTICATGEFFLEGRCGKCPPGCDYCPNADECILPSAQAQAASDQQEQREAEQRRAEERFAEQIRRESEAASQSACAEGCLECPEETCAVCGPGLLLSKGSCVTACEYSHFVCGSACCDCALCAPNASCYDLCESYPPLMHKKVISNGKASFLFSQRIRPFSFSIFFSTNGTQIILDEG